MVVRKNGQKVASKGVENKNKMLNLAFPLKTDVITIYNKIQVALILGPHAHFSSKTSHKNKFDIIYYRLKEDILTKSILVTKKLRLNH